MNTALPTPHLEKLRAVLDNAKLPRIDRPRIKEAVERYGEWVESLRTVQGSDLSDTIAKMVRLLNDYRNYLDIDIIFDSKKDFLYRQMGQIKLDNSVMEEFLPHLIQRCVVEKLDDQTIDLGPKKAFSAIYFTSTLDNSMAGGGLHVRTKDQDFAVARKVFLKTSYSSDFDRSETSDFYVAYLAAECKKNLDKTMFQEASATAHDVKAAVVGSKYLLLCEWLDMTPQSTAATDIDSVLILRKAKRISSNIRKDFGKAVDRRANRNTYVEFLESNSFKPDVFELFVAIVGSLMNSEAPLEDDVLTNGYF